MLWNGGLPEPGSGGQPVTNISWYAAEAYARWFSGKYARLSGLTARLPKEDEWEAAARLNGVIDNINELPPGLKAASAADAGEIGLRGMAGNVREWCLDTYRINDNLFRTSDGRKQPVNIQGLPVTPEKVVRGGAFVDGNLDYPVVARGGLPGSFTSPAVGFRLVLE